MKICEFSSWVSILEPKMGNEVYIYQISRTLVRLGHQVDLFALGDKVLDKNLDGIHIHHVATSGLMFQLAKTRVVQNLLRTLRMPNAFKLFFGLLPNLAFAARHCVAQADVILVHYADQIFPLLLARWLGRPVILATHALHTVWVRQLRSILPFPSYCARLTYYLITDFIGYMLADLILVTSACEKSVALKTWRHISPVKIEVLPNAVDTEVLCPDLSARILVRQHLAIPDSALAVGFTSGMRQDVTNLEAARYIINDLAKVIWQDFPDTYFLIVGDHTPGSLNLSGDKRLIVTGFVDKLSPYLNAIDIAIAPYRVGRGAKLKTVEAMACGKVVVATPQAIGGYAVTSGENALVCEMADFPKTLKETIANYAVIKDVMGQRARELVTTYYSWQSVGAQLVNTLDELRSGKDGKH